MKIKYQKLETVFCSILTRYGFPDGDAVRIAAVFAETTFDGIFSHGINRFPRFIRDVRDGIVNPGATPELTAGSGALEQWDGKQAAGILNALHCAERAVELAKASGIGCVGLRNTNHWLRGGTYGWKVAREGFLFIGWTNTTPNMPPWGGSTASLGNNPLVMAIPRREGHVVLDMAMSQYSYGKLEWHQRCGTNLPEFGGYNRENELTKDPSEILDSERILPVGLWKGSGLSMVLDLAAAIISGGNTSREIGGLSKETSLSQVFIAIDIERHLSPAQVNALINETLGYTKSLNPEARYPGQGTLEKRIRHLEYGVEIPEEMWSEIEKLRSS